MSLSAISPVDGRYESKTRILNTYFSEKALIRYRVYTEIQYFIRLIRDSGVTKHQFSKKEEEILKSLEEISEKDAELVQQIETKGYEQIPATNHDVKAIEYFIKLKFQGTELEKLSEMVHFALTSEDINNISHSLMLRDGWNSVVFPELIRIYSELYKLALDNKNTPMLARTHGQPASPTTFGKEILVFVKRLQDEILYLSRIPILVKINGATGNYNAHSAGYPDIDWISFMEKFVAILKSGKTQTPEFCSGNSLEISFNPITTQIEPHDSMGRIFDSMKRINTILVDFCQDIWRYVSDGWIRQKPVKGEIGSSAMPHKVNPIDFENAEGNLGMANTLLSFFSSKLSISRLQRDLSDSTVQRNIGVALAHTLIAFLSIRKGLSKIELDKAKILSVLENTPEVLAEAFQTILRREGVERPYELLKDLTRGKTITLADFQKLAESLPVKPEVKKQLLSLKPAEYTGLATRIVEGYDPRIF